MKRSIAEIAGGCEARLAARRRGEHWGSEILKNPGQTAPAIEPARTEDCDPFAGLDVRAAREREARCCIALHERRCLADGDALRNCEGRRARYGNVGRVAAHPAQCQQPLTGGDVGARDLRAGCKRQRRLDLVATPCTINASTSSRRPRRPQSPPNHGRQGQDQLRQRWRVGRGDRTMSTRRRTGVNTPSYGSPSVGGFSLRRRKNLSSTVSTLTGPGPVKISQKKTSA